MKLASVRLHGKPTFGIVREDGFVDLGARLQGRCADLIALFESPMPAEVLQWATEGAVDARLDQLEWLPVNPRQDMRMFALGWAYKAHQLEAGKEDLTHPNMFSKHPQSLVGHEQPIVRPRVSPKFDFEGEVALVIGRGGRHIPAAQAMAHVAGYSIVMDGSVRDYQKHSVTAGKNFDASSAFGPWMVTADEIADPNQLDLWIKVNGEMRQQSNTRHLVYDVARLIEFASSFYTLEPGDVIMTGTPEGVGPVLPGDILEAGIEQVGGFTIRIAPAYAVAPGTA